MRSNQCIVVALIVGLSITMTARAESVGERLHKGLYQEETVGDLEAAMKIYQEIVADDTANRPHVAQAKYRLGMCHLKKGQKKEAIETFGKLIEEFPRQTTLIEQARGQLTTLGHVPDTPGNSRLVWTYQGLSEVMSISPDGRYLAFRDQETGDLSLRDLTTGKNRRLTASGADGESSTTEAVFSPDGQWLAYNWRSSPDARTDLRVMRLDGSESRVVFDDEKMKHVVPRGWSPDGANILARLWPSAEDVTQIALVSVANGSVRVVRSFNWQRSDDQRMVLSPDGRYIAYDYLANERSDQEDIALFPVDGGPEIRVIEHPGDDDLMGWAPDGRSLLFRSDRRGEGDDAWVIQVIDGKPQGLPQRVEKGIHMGGSVSNNGLFTRDGSFYFVVRRQSPGWDSDVYVATLDPKTGRVVGDPQKVSQRFDGQTAGGGWSPDGKHLVYAAQPVSASWNSPQLIVIRDMETGQEREIPLKPEFRVKAWGKKFWSPDGRTVFFLGGDRRDNTGVCRLDVKTGEITFVVPPSDGTETILIGLAPGGKSLFFGHSRGDGRYAGQILVKNLETGHEEELYGETSGAGGALSPDGQWLAFKSPSYPQQKSLLVMPASGGEPREVLRLQQTGPFGRAVRWAPDGRHLLFFKKGERRDGKQELQRIPVEGGEPEKVGLAFDNPTAVQFHPDGARFTFTNWTQRPSQELWVLENFLPDLTTPQDIVTGANRILPHINRLFQKNDSNRDGAVTKDEARAIFLANFATYDANGDGRVELTEFKNAFDQTKMPGRLSRPMKEEDLQRLFAEHEPFDFDFSLPDLDGKKVSLKDFAGQLVIVNFWGTWCFPCRREMPHLVALYEKYLERGVEIVGVTYERQEGQATIDSVRTFLKEKGVTYPCVIGDDDTRRQGPKSDVFPRTMFIDRNGEVRLVLTGYLSMETLEAVVNRLLEGILSVELVGPGRDAYFDSEESVPLQAKTTATSGAAVARVEFLVDGSSVASDEQLPFEAAWQATTTGRHVLAARAFDADGRQYDSQPVSVFVGIRGLARTVARSEDDAEESGTGKMDLDSSDLDLGQVWNGERVVGIRFADIHISKGAQIKEAYLQFTAEGDAEAEPTEITIHAELVANANDFTTGDISSRKRTEASVKWSPKPWNASCERSDKQRTPDLSALIQEVVAQDDWRHGNSLVLIITGSGERDAESYDGDPSAAPALYVKF